MTKIIKVDCDKWNERLDAAFWIFVNVAALALWGGLTFGLVYLQYHIVQNWNWIFDNLSYMVWVFFIGNLIFNVINFYYVIRTIYRNQNALKFECVSKDLSKKDYD